MSKTLVNNLEDIVVEALDAWLLTQPHLTRLDGFPDVKVVLRRDWDKSRVAVLSGGGSGHEPSHCGLCGSGMLTAAVAGNVFASPSVAAVTAAILATTGPKGALLVVKNYTGDRLNFGLAAETAVLMGLDVRVLFVCDDVSLEPSPIVGRRGIAGTVFVHKLVGAAAERGLSLDAVYSVGVAAAECVKSVGVALGTCTVPGAPTRNSRLDGDVVEMGLGIHGEPGVAKRSLQTANETTDAMLTILLKAFGDSLPLSVAVLVNNLGGASALEVSLVLGRTVATLTEKGIAVLRVYSGHVMTALNMHGVSISLLPIQKPEWLELLDDPVTASGWPSGGDPRARSPLVPLPHNPARTVTATKSCEASESGALLAHRTIAACDEVISVVPLLTELDTLLGDGDCGVTFQRGAHAIRTAAVEYLAQRPSELECESPAAFFSSLSSCMGAMGGSSGVLLQIMASSAAVCASKCEGDVGAVWADAFVAAVGALRTYGKADRGYGTMLDPFLAVCDAITSGEQRLSVLASAAGAAAEATSTMPKLAGRASYSTHLQPVADPGSIAIAAIFKGIANA